MKFSAEYIEFERRHLGALTTLWYETNNTNEDLRALILLAREVLKNVFDGADQVIDHVR